MAIPVTGIPVTVYLTPKLSTQPQRCCSTKARRHPTLRQAQDERKTMSPKPLTEAAPDKSIWQNALP
jgi:hypothetical protein